jgi:hypothetical protein
MRFESAPFAEAGFEVRTKNGAKPADLLAFIAWCEIMIGKRMALNGVILDPGKYDQLRSDFALHIGIMDGLRDKLFVVETEADRDKIIACFPKLIDRSDEINAARQAAGRTRAARRRPAP